MELSVTSESGYGPGVFVIWLSRNVLGDIYSAWRIESLEMSTESSKRMIYFKKKEMMEAALEEHLSKNLVNYLPAGTDRSILQAPEFMLSLPRLVLNGLSITAHAVKDGAQRVMVLFKRVVGSAESALRPHLQARPSEDEVLTDVAMRTIIDLVEPCLQLANVTAPREPELSENLEARLKVLSSNRDELEMYIALLKRFVAQSRN